MVSNCLKSVISPRSIEISGSVFMTSASRCWRCWGRRWGCWGRKTVSKSGLVGTGGLSRWSEGVSSLIPLSEGEGTQRGEQGCDTPSDACNRESRKLSTTPSPWHRICRNTKESHKTVTSLDVLNWQKDDSKVLYKEIQRNYVLLNFLYRKKCITVYYYR